MEEIFCLHSGEIVAVSQSIQVERVNNAIRMVGPGWVFFEPSTQKTASYMRMGTIFIVFFLYGVVLPLIYEYV